MPDMYYSVTCSLNEEKANYIIEANSVEEAKSILKSLCPGLSNVKIDEAEEIEVFDYFIKQKFLSGDPYLPGQHITSIDNHCFGFKLKRFNTVYDRYFAPRMICKSLFSEAIRNSYIEGKGNEFSTGKFYSVGSSSRFIVSSFCEFKDDIHICQRIGDDLISNPEFEHGCKVDGIDGTPPQLDMYFASGDRTFFIEAKCHEILSCHKNIELMWSYFTNSDILRAKILAPLNVKHTGWKCRIKKDKKNKQSEYLVNADGNLTAEDFGIQLRTFHFDFKQFLCHLMGILSSKEYKAGQQINFYYLFYKSDDERFKSLYSELEAEIEAIATRFKSVFGEQISFGYIYNDQFDTLKSLKPTKCY